MKVLISGTKQEKTDITVDAKEVATVPCRQILRKHCLHLDYYVENGKIVSWDSCHGGSGYTEVIVEKPSTEQLIALELCKRFVKEVEKLK